MLPSPARAAAARRRPLFVPLVVAAAAFSPAARAATSYTVTMLGSGFASSSAQGINGGRVAMTGTAADGSSTAAIWTTASGSRAPLAVGTGFGSAEALAIDGSTVAGQAYSTAGGFYHAYTWNLADNSFRDLNPAGYDQSIANGTSGGAFVGAGSSAATTGGASRALYWPSALAAPINLTPSSASDAVALGIGGGVQVGSATITAGGHVHAMAWSGTAEGFVDLHKALPATLTESSATAIAGTQVVGTAYDLNGVAHAILWDTAGTRYTDLTPGGYLGSDGAVTNGAEQAGDVIAGDGSPHAAVWTGGTADSVVDLQPFLPAGYVGSTAYAIDPAGRIAGVAYDVNSVATAFLWTPVPEPAGLVPFAMAVMAAGRRRRRRVGVLRRLR